VAPDRVETLVTAGFWAFMPVLVTGVLVVVSSRAANGRLQRNQWVGIRTRSTMRTDQGWVAGHRAALRLVPLYLVTTVVVWVGLGVAVIYATGNVVHLVGFAVFAVILALVFYSALVANNAAKAAEGGPDHGRQQ
jgi:hypothetical protein